MVRDGLVSLSLSFHEEQLEHKGEDASVCVSNAPNGAMIASLDGCGGAGAQIYAKAGNTSGARLASHHVGMAIREWFLNSQYGYYGTGDSSAQALAQEIKTAIDKRLMLLMEKYGQEESGVTSRLSRTFPTTLAMMMAEIVDVNQVRCLSFWAGDSRTYLFRASGLQQTSDDDIRRNADPFVALENDSRLTNLVSASNEYRINVRETVVTEPCMILTATDGCFSYFQSPMEFEWILLDTLVHSETPAQWEEYLRSVFGKYAADDYTMEILILGFQNWSAVRTAYAKRWEEFKTNYYLPLERILAEENRQEHLELWNRYKRYYLAREEWGQ